MNKDPLSEIYKKYGLEFSNINDVGFGSIYNFVSNSSISSGVAATLNSKLYEFPKKIDINIIAHRSILLAYYNSVFNYRSNYQLSIDLITEMKIKSTDKISMIGNFRPIVKNLLKIGIKPYVFDLFCEFPEVLDENRKDDLIDISDVLIISATSIINNTFFDEISRRGKNTRVYLLGPSSLMLPFLKDHYGIERIFGSIIINPSQVKRIITEGGGTSLFSKFTSKVML